MTTDTTASNQNPGEGSGTTDATTTSTEQQGAPTTTAAAPESAEQAGGKPATEGDGKTEGDGTATDAPKDDGQPAGAPEQYEAFQLPEGFTLEGERLDKAVEFFKAKNWSQAEAQEAIALYTQLAAEDAGLVKAALEQQTQQRIAEWGEQSRAELGDKYTETEDLARTAVAAVGSEKLLEAFNEHGWGNHPELIKAFAFFGKLARDSAVDTGNAASATAGPKSLAAVMYPGMNP